MGLFVCGLEGSRRDLGLASDESGDGERHFDSIEEVGEYCEGEVASRVLDD